MPEILQSARRRPPVLLCSPPRSMRSGGRRGRRRGARNRRVTAWRERRREGRRPRRGGSPTTTPMRPDDDSEAGREAGGARSARGRSSLPRSAVLLPELRGRGRHKEGRGGDDRIPEPEIRSPHRSRLDASTPPPVVNDDGKEVEAEDTRLAGSSEGKGGSEGWRRCVEARGGVEGRRRLRGGARRSGRAAPSWGQEAEVTGDKKRKRPPRARGPARSAARAGAGARGRWCRWRRAVARWAAGASVGGGGAVRGRGVWRVASGSSRLGPGRMAWG
ncbi:hypothetical protein PVAP13_9KG038989 [Panicum virgatum]|uniref:Uncharacterized protein n=1 Tax=Panicum virgatum TaxID=38727 RepID=A0A8T0NDC6_PANVG|nr:hypothetical protein PVAP13_9KG038989 [Panicum virgatum]